MLKERWVEKRGLISHSKPWNHETKWWFILGIGPFLDLFALFLWPFSCEILFQLQPTPRITPPPPDPSRCRVVFRLFLSRFESRQAIDLKTTPNRPKNDSKSAGKRLELWLPWRGVGGSGDESRGGLWLKKNFTIFLRLFPSKSTWEIQKTKGKKRPFSSDILRFA